MVTYNVRSLDVWGHAAPDVGTCQWCGDKECPGFEVNQSFAAGKIEVPDDATDEVILRTLVEDGYMLPAALTRASVIDDGDGSFLSIEANNDGQPLYWLELDDEG